MKRLALVEDDILLAKRLASFLNSTSDFSCELIAHSLGGFFEQLDTEAPPQILLMDIELSDTVNTIDHIKKIKALIPSSGIIVITGHNHSDYIQRAISNGADGFYLKGSGLKKLIEAIESTLDGGLYLAPKAAKHLLGVIKQAPSAAPPPGESLAMVPPPQIESMTEREREIASGLINGDSYKEISSNCNISINTVRHYVKVLYKKFEVDNKVAFTNKVKPFL
jgi:DNA-binding NarL/FixJ family response regulator